MKLKAKIARRIGEPLVGQAKKVSVIKRNFPPGRLDSQRKHKTQRHPLPGTQSVTQSRRPRPAGGNA